MNPEEPVTDALRRAAGDDASPDEAAWRSVRDRIEGARRRGARRAALVVVPILAAAGIGVGVAEGLAPSGHHSAVAVSGPTTTATPTVSAGGPPASSSSAPAPRPRSTGTSTTSSSTAPPVSATTPLTRPLVIVPPAPGSRGTGLYPAATSADLQRLVRAHPAPVEASPVVASTEGSLAAVAYGPVQAHVEIARWTGIAWQPLAVLSLAPARVDRQVADDAIVAARITGGTMADFGVEVEGIGGPTLAVASRVSGTWRLLDFAATSGPATRELLAGRVVGTSVVQRRDSCLPDCAEGVGSTVVYRWDNARGEIVPT